MTTGNTSDILQFYPDLPCTDAYSGVILSPAVVSILNWILLSGLCQGIAVFGTCANLVNIACFIKQGFKDSVDVSLFGKYSYLMQCNVFRKLIH